MQILDKERYSKQLVLLGYDDIKALKQFKKNKRELKKMRPKPGLSPYMYFVINHRKCIVAESPEANFQNVGKLLGVKWNSMSNEDKLPFSTLSLIDKERQKSEMLEYAAMKKTKIKDKQQETNGASQETYQETSDASQPIQTV
jgi:hypothetical protein